MSTDTTQVILLTGAGGNMGEMLRDRLARPGRILRLLDLAEPGQPVREREELVLASVTDQRAVSEACAGVDAIVHLGGLSKEAPWQEILDVNVHGTRTVLEGAHEHGVRRVVLASSNHAVGYYTRDDAPAAGLPADLPARPDSYYGWSKTALESLAQLYTDTYGMDVVCLRIGTCFDRPRDTRGLSTWMSPDDAGRLLEAALGAAPGPMRYVWGISRNTRRWFSLEAGERIGYHPMDDAEVFAPDLIARLGEPDLGDPVHRLVGGQFCLVPLGERM